MSRAAARPRPNPVWLLVVVFMAGMALAGPVIIVRDRLADRAAAPSAAEGAQPAAAARSPLHGPQRASANHRLGLDSRRAVEVLRGELMVMADRDADYYQAHKDAPEEWGDPKPARGPRSDGWRP